MRRLRTTAPILALLGLLALACGKKESTAPPAPGPSAAAPAPAAEAPAAEAPAPKPAPAPAPTPPEPATPAPAPAPEGGAATGTAAGTPYACIPGDAKAGAVKYAQLCATCHGAKGDGQGPSAAGLNPKPALHNDGHYMNALSNEHVFKVISQGGPSVGKSPLMAAWGGALSDQEIWDVVAFVRTLAVPPYHCP